MEPQKANPALVRVAPESMLNVLGVIYVHRKTSDGGDMYLTRLGLPYADLLAIENWHEEQWFEQRRERLEGTSAVYRVPTKQVNGRSLDLVVKNCRVGENVPLDTHTLEEFINAEFNSPWEEFALVMEMRDGAYGPGDIRINTQEPLAIYVPPERLQLWQTGRSVAKINKINARHPGIDLDILRQYKLIYGWIQGRNVVEAFEELGIHGADLLQQLAPITRAAVEQLDKKGYAVADMKPAHIIIGRENLGMLGTVSGPSAEARARLTHELIAQGAYSIVDYELLLRTPTHEQAVKASRRHSYLDDVRDRFVPTPLPEHLKFVEVFGVPYVWGHVESTGGQLFVVGRNSRLFDYFLPERWRKTPHRKLSLHNEVYYTLTKDNIHIVWKTSRVGERPDPNLYIEHASLVEEYGFNSPFEEFAIAQFLNSNGVPTVYKRAIYMTGTTKLELSVDLRRFDSHRAIAGPDGNPILQDNHNYITIRGFFNGPDSWVASHETQLYRPMDLIQALAQGVISRGEYLGIFDVVKQNLRNVGYDGTLLEGNDVLIALDPEGRLARDADGRPEARICNVELVRKAR